MNVHYPGRNFRLFLKHFVIYFYLSVFFAFIPVCIQKYITGGLCCTCCQSFLNVQHDPVINVCAQILRI